ncbi:hypothetical protein KDU71_07460 [Carboxylicivirga sediminis]|uniref:Major capsid protein n=1 Tax=Carboxylicivirga sediminis TaxID=2006564 RepID=A0A941IXA0_9BACT|nr:hypothetical protein [Carboxylicivirga sediminis]MBR8535393.1 hypothetical protein [Carboxylicivirga sediminis]
MDGVQWKKWFRWKYTPTLTFEGILAKSARVYAGTVVAEGARAPRRERQNLQPFTGSVASMKDGFQLGHKEMRDMLDLEDAIKRGVVNGDAVMNHLFPDIQALMLAPHKRLDIWSGQIMSNGTATVDASDNPNGVQFTVDFGVTKDKVITKAWSTLYADHKPITDIRTILEEQKAKGKQYSKIKMSRVTFNKMIASSEIAGTFNMSFKSGNKTYTNTPQNIITLEMINAQFAALGLPIVELIEYGVQIYDGTLVYPFKDDVFTLHADDMFGDAWHSYAVEERLPDKKNNKTYSKSDNVLFKYTQGEDERIMEYELNAFLTPNVVNSMLIVDTANKRA